MIRSHEAKKEERQSTVKVPERVLVQAEKATLVTQWSVLGHHPLIVSFCDHCFQMLI